MPNRRSKRPQGHHPSTVVQLKPVPAVVIPEPPSDISDESKALWSSYWRSDVSRAVEEPDHHALKRWIESVDERERLVVAVRDSTTVEGSTGQPVLNPLAKRLDTLEGQIERFERQFGMTPKARADLGIAAGNAAMTAEQLNRMANDAQPDKDKTSQKRKQAKEAEGFIEA